MSVSIVTVVLDDGAGLPLTIESVRQQDYRDVELIVVDGGSRDNTADVLQLYANEIDKVVRLQDAGIYHAMNAALEHCSKEFVLFLNANDTLFTASTLRNLMDCREPDTDVLFGNHVYVRDHREHLKRAIDYVVSMGLLRLGNVDHLWLSRLPGHQATLVKLDILRQLRFDTSIMICADHDLMVRAYNAGARFQYVDETVARYIGGGFSARRPSKLTLEWSRLYREQSSQPQVIDRFFFGSLASPFGPQNQVLGEWICGNYPIENARPDEGIRKPVYWCRPRIVFRAPVREHSNSLTIEGYNPFEWQLLVFLHQDLAIGQIRIERGWFRRNVEFDTRLNPSAIVEVTATRLGSVPLCPYQPVVLAISNFKFETIVPRKVSMTPGALIRFTDDNAAQADEVLVDGWSKLESELIWTIGKTASVDLHVSSTVKFIVVRCRGNPFIEDADARGFNLALNGRAAGRHLLTTGEENKIEIDVAPLPADGHLTLTFHPLLRREPPGDGRPLGFALMSLEFRGSDQASEECTRRTQSSLLAKSDTFARSSS